MESHVLGEVRYQMKNPWVFRFTVQQCPVSKGQNAYLFSAGKKTETLSLVNRCIFGGLSVQSAIGRAQRQMKQCIQSPCVIKHLKLPTVPVFPFEVRNHCISLQYIHCKENPKSCASPKGI